MLILKCKFAVLCACAMLSTATFGMPTTVNETKLTPSDGTGDVFGFSASISGNVAIVGDPFDDDNGMTSGSAYLFDPTTGDQLFKLLPNDGASFSSFGWSVGISGDRAIVGSFSAGSNDAGAAYVFDVVTGQQLHKLTPNDPRFGHHFGNSVAIDGNIAVIGARDDGDKGFSAGAAYVFDVSTGDQLLKLTASDGARSDDFGFSVAVRGTTAVVGALSDFDNGVISGSAYVFDVGTGEELMKLLPTDGVGRPKFGFSVDLAGGLAVIGAREDRDNGFQAGAAYVFDLGTGDQLFKLLPRDGREQDFFGHSVGISGSLAVIGAIGDDTNNGSSSGSAYVFDLTSGEETLKLTASDGVERALFGHSVGFSGDMAVVGAPFAAFDAAYVFSPLGSDLSNGPPLGPPFEPPPFGPPFGDPPFGPPIGDPPFGPPFAPHGDGNLNGVVEAADYTIWANGFGGASPQFADGDYNVDGSVNAADYTIWANNFGQSILAAQSAPSAIPEPSSLTLASFGLIALLAYGWKRRRRA